MKIDVIKKIWNVLKQIIEIILAALGGLAAGHAASACNMLSFLG